MINLQLINQQEEQTVEINIVSIVNSHVEKINYSKYITNSDISLSCIESEELNSIDNLNIQNLSWVHPRNNINFENEITEVNTKSFILPYKEVLITDQYSIDVEDNINPLFYKHKKQLKEATIEIKRAGKELEELNGYKFVNNYLYTNYNNQYDYDTGSYVLYYVVGTDLDGNPVNELLNLEPSIKEATWEDIDLDSGELRNNVYTKDILPEGTSFRISSDVKKDCGEEENIFYIKNVQDNIIELLKPDSISINNAWNLKVRNGAFWSNKKYWISEFETQSFNPEYGVLKNIFKDSFIVNENIIKVPSINLYYKLEENVHIEILIYQEDELVEAITSNNLIVGQRYNNKEVFWENKILHVDEKNGFIELDKSLEINKTVKVTYFYKTDNYLIKEISVNPIYNKNVVNNKYYFYLKPNMLAGEKSIEYLILDEDDIILNCSQENLKEEYLNEFNPNTILNETLDTFKNLYEYKFENEYEYLPLGEVSLVEDYYVDEINFIDIKSQEKINLETSVNRQWKILQSNYGYGEKGQAVQKSNILYLKVPEKLLKTMSEKDIEKSLRRKLKAATDIVIEYDKEESLLTITLPVVKKVKIQFSWEGIGNYKLYRSSSEAGEKVLIYEKESNQKELVGYVDTDVISGEKYYYWSRYNDNSFGRTYGVEVR